MQVSIIIPCFNAEKYVADAVASALNQSWRDLEVIVVNDGSTDRSLEKVLQIQDERLKVISQPHSGQCSACNRGFRVSTGRLIKFFDADDILDAEMINLQMSRLNGRQDAVAMGEWKRFFGHSPDDSHFPSLPMYRDASPAEWLVQEFSSARPMMLCSLWLIPRSIIDQRGLWDERLSLTNDFEYFARLLLGAKEILYTPGARVHYRSGLQSSLSGRTSRNAIESQILSLELGTKHLLSARNDFAALQACANILQDFDYSHFPTHRDLRARAQRLVAELGGSSLEPDGPPGFQMLRAILGWRLARRIQKIAEATQLNSSHIARRFAFKRKH